jgi:hypothetical protein
MAHLVLVAWEQAANTGWIVKFHIMDIMRRYYTQIPRISSRTIPALQMLHLSLRQQPVAQTSLGTMLFFVQVLEPKLATFLSLSVLSAPAILPGAARGAGLPPQRGLAVGQRQRVLSPDQ